jgi:hypothetical protein
MMTGEILFFIEDDDIATATLLFPPNRVLAITNAAGDILYEERRDYLVEIGLPGCRPNSGISRRARCVMRKDL